MREDDGLGHYVPILRRIIVLVAVIVAVPVMLWTITVFVRTYVGPPRIPTFHQLVSTASINAPSARTSQDGAAATAGCGPGLETDRRGERVHRSRRQHNAGNTNGGRSGGAPHPALRGQAYFRRLRLPRPTATARRRKAARVPPMQANRCPPRSRSRARFRCHGAGRVKLKCAPRTSRLPTCRCRGDGPTAQARAPARQGNVGQQSGRIHSEPVSLKQAE